MKRSPQFWILAVFFLSALAMTVSAQAQPRRPGGAGGPPGGFGAFGQRPGGFGGGVGVLGLLRSEVARTEVGVDEATAEKVRTAAEETMRQGREGREGMGNFRDMSQEEREKALEKFRAQMEQRTKALEEKVREIIGADKFKHLKQIELQLAGVNALNRPEVLKDLGVSEETKEKINAAFDANREEMRKMFEGARDMNESERAGLRTRMTGLREKLQKDVMSLLNAGEKEKLGQMMGAPVSEEKLAQIREQTRGGQPGGQPGGQRGGQRGGERGGQRGGDRGDRGGERGGERPRRSAT